MNTEGTHPTPSPDDARDSAFLACTVLGVVAGVIAATVGSALAFGGEYAEGLAVVGALLGGTGFGAVGAAVIGPVWAAVAGRGTVTPAPVPNHVVTH